MFPTSPKSRPTKSAVINTGTHLDPVWVGDAPTETLFPYIKEAITTSSVLVNPRIELPACDHGFRRRHRLDPNGQSALNFAGTVDIWTPVTPLRG